MTVWNWRTILAALLLLATGSAPALRAAAPAASDATTPATTPAQPARREAPPAGSAAVVVSLVGQVDNYNRDLLIRNFAKARKLAAKVVILRIDTYGGGVAPGREISQFIKQQTDLHTIALVDDKAISAGAMIAVACDEIFMVPSSRIGDCAPIIFKSDQTLESLPPAERSKQESPVLAEFRDSATRNGYDRLLLEAMVSTPVTVHYVEDGEGRRRFVDAATYRQLAVEGWKPVAGLPNPVDDANSLLTVSDTEAIQLGLARGHATSADALAAGRGYAVAARYTPNFGDQLVRFLANDWVRGLLLIIFLQSLFIALHTPGHGAAEAVCLLALGLLVGIPLLTGFAQWWEILLVFAGLALIAFEIFVFPGHLVSLIAGIVMVLGGLLLTFVGGDVWSVPGGWRMPNLWVGLERGIYVIVGGLLSSVLLAAWLRRYLPRMPYANRLILSTVAGGQVERSGPLDLPAGDAAGAGTADDDVDAWPFVGTVGRAVSDLKPGGTAEFPYGADTRVTAVVSDSGYVRSGTRLAVREVRGNRVVVRTAGGGDR